MNNKILQHELELWDKGIKFVAGVDEVGRGALAGPMVVSAVILNSEHFKEYKNFPEKYKLYEEIRDSKQLTSNKRHYLAQFIQKEALSYSIVVISNTDIDKLGLTDCTEITFYKSINSLALKPEHILTDAFKIKRLDTKSQTNLIKGDQLSITIAAASIVAKVYRDDLMTNIHTTNPKYQIYRFDKHKGYATELHTEMIKKHGYSDLHRKSFILKS